MSVQVEYDDSCTPWLEAALKNFPQYDRRAMKSVGWMLSKKMKEGIRSFLEKRPPRFSGR